MAGHEEYTYVGTPDVDSGQRLPPPEELAEMAMNDPDFQAAINLVEKASFAGKPTAVKMMCVKAVTHCREEENHALEQSIALELQQFKAKEGNIS